MQNLLTPNDISIIEGNNKAHVRFNSFTADLHMHVMLLDDRLKSVEHAPHYATEGSAGLDLCACIQEPLVLSPNNTAVLIPTGLSIALPGPMFVALLLPRSGMGHKQGLVLGNGTGVIDSDYRGQVMISAFNRGTHPITINPMDRIAQMLVVPAFQIRPMYVTELPSTDRGAGGFGSTTKEQNEPQPQP